VAQASIGCDRKGPSELDTNYFPGIFNQARSAVLSAFRKADIRVLE